MTTFSRRTVLQLMGTGALALGVMHVLGRLPQLTTATRVVLVVAAAVTVAGVLAMAVGLFTGLDALLPLGQALMWLSLGFALLYLVGQLPRRREGRTFGLRPVDDDDEDIGHDDVAAT